MGHADAPERLRVAVVYSPGAGRVDEQTVDLARGATVAEALACSGMLQRHPEIDLATQRVGVWGSVRALDDVLRDRDRVEVYRPLAVDPKEARRLRYRQHLERYRP
jgi:putative ubiquitin-RnfH superfamily antitoxin RatB of RatAB toxin-antitoxin module